jgi:hypothetical protein
MIYVLFLACIDHLDIFFVFYYYNSYCTHYWCYLIICHLLELQQISMSFDLQLLPMFINYSFNSCRNPFYHQLISSYISIQHRITQISIRIIDSLAFGLLLVTSPNYG